MKLISFIIPAYNSEKYLNIAVDSLLIAGNDVEIIIINDGSKDQTLAVANSYKGAYPDIVRVIDKVNGGHGSGINTGLLAATGLYFKVIDSDDWVDAKSLTKLIEQIKDHIDKHQEPDMYITNFVYEHVEDDTKFERDYSPNFPINQIFDWSHTKKAFKYSKTLMMHALIYKTHILKDIDLEMPEHTFYVDNLFAYVPLPFMKSIYYMKIPFYRYFIGRPDQSVTLKNITARYDQQIRVFRLMSDAYTYDLINKLPNGLSSYMKHCIGSMMIITQMFTVANDSQERRTDLKNLWKHVKENDINLFHYLKYRSFNKYLFYLPWRIRSFVMVNSYLYLAKKIKLG